MDTYLAEVRGLRNLDHGDTMLTALADQVKAQGGTFQDGESFVYGTQDGGKSVCTQATVRVSDPKLIKGWTLIKTR